MKLSNLVALILSSLNWKNLVNTMKEIYLSIRNSKYYVIWTT